MSKLKATMSQDGLRRLTVRVEYRLDLRRIATIYTDSQNLYGTELAPDEFAKNRAALVSIEDMVQHCRNALYFDGMEAILCRVTDTYLGGYAEALYAELKRLYGDQLD